MNIAQWTPENIEDWLTERIAQILNRPIDDIDPEAPFHSLGMDSINAMNIIVALEDLLGIEIESTIAWDYPTIRLLSEHVAALV